MNTYFGYIRVSTAKQGEGVSLDQQKSAIAGYARMHGLNVVDWFEEKESASKLGRPVFNRMLDELERRRIHGIVIHKIDRSARHLTDWVWIGQLIERGIDVRFVHENLDLTTRSGRLTGDMLAVIAADYSRNLRDEVKKGLYGRLKQGLYPFRAPLGYLDQGGGKTKTIDPIRGPLVRRAFELYTTRRYSLDTLRVELHRQGLRARRGKALSRESLSAILNNPFYMGLMRVARTGERFAGTHEPLVTRNLFDRVQAILRDRTNTKVVMHEFTFRRLIRCAACSYVLTAERQKGHVYYRCHQRSCPGVSIREDDILSELRWFSEIIRFEEEDLREMRDFVEADMEDAAENRAVEEARIRRAFGLCEERLERLTDAVIDGLLDKEAFEARKRSLLSERQELLERLKSPPEDTPAEERLKKFELANMAYLGLVSAASYEIREAVEKTTSNLTLEGKNLVFKPRFPFDEIAKTRIFGQCGHYRAELRTDGSIHRTLDRQSKKNLDDVENTS